MVQIINLSLKLWKRQIRRVDFWIVILVLGMFYWSYFNAGREYMKVMGDTVGAFSVFPVAMSEMTFILVTYACYLILISDVPVIWEGMEYQILRISRMKWYISQILYIIFYDITFFLLTVIMQLACYFPLITFDGEWGTGIRKGTAFLSFSISVPDNLLGNMPVKVFGQAFLLFVLLGLLFALICFICNLLGTHDGLGILICTLAIAWRAFLFYNFYNGVDLGYFSPVGLLGSYYGYTWVTVRSAAAFYIFFSCLIVLAGIFRIGRTDLKCGAGH